MNIRPLGPHVIVKPVQPETMSAGGIHLPEVAQGRRSHMDNTALVGDVVGVGDGYQPSRPVHETSDSFDAYDHVITTMGHSGTPDERRSAFWNKFHSLGRDRIPLDVKVGDRVLYGAHLGEEITIDGEKYQKLHELHILAIVES